MVSFISILPSFDTLAGSEPLAREEVACRNVPEQQRDASVFIVTENIRSIRGMKGDRGARIVLMPAPGLTAEGLQQIAECHMALLAATGPTSRGHRSPLDVTGASVSVKSNGGSFTVDITSPDRHTGHTILVRARALLPHRPPHHFGLVSIPIKLISATEPHRSQ